jgi:hypothetical protein
MALRVLVTGSTGLIGTELFKINSKVQYIALGPMDLLQEGAENRVVNQSKEFGCSMILNLAWASNSHSSFSRSVLNQHWQEFSDRLSKLCVEENICFAGVGSVAEIEPGRNDAYTMAKRNHFSFLSPYMSLNQAIWLRPFYIFDTDKLRPQVLNFLRENSMNSTINSPDNLHDYIMTSDVASAINFALSKQLQGIIEIGSGKLTTNRKLVEKICELKGVPSPIMNPETTFQDSQPFASIQKLLDNGWTPENTQKFFSNRGTGN